MQSTNKPPKWTEIEAIAKRLGVSDWALRKWAERGNVPGKWHVPIIVESKGKVTARDFVEVAKPAPSEQGAAA